MESEKTRVEIHMTDDEGVITRMGYFAGENGVAHRRCIIMAQAIGSVTLGKEEVVALIDLAVQGKVISREDLI